MAFPWSAYCGAPAAKVMPLNCVSGSKSLLLPACPPGLKAPKRTAPGSTGARAPIRCAFPADPGRAARPNRVRFDQHGRRLNQIRSGKGDETRIDRGAGYLTIFADVSGCRVVAHIRHEQISIGIDNDGGRVIKSAARHRHEFADWIAAGVELVNIVRQHAHGVQVSAGIEDQSICP